MSVGHDPEAMKKVLNRLKRAEGQLHALVASIGPEANCRDVVTQLAAVSKARQGRLRHHRQRDGLVRADDEEGEGNHDGMTQTRSRSCSSASPEPAALTRPRDLNQRRESALRREQIPHPLERFDHRDRLAQRPGGMLEKPSRIASTTARTIGV